MSTTNRWSIEVLIGEDEGHTYAEAHLTDDIGNHLVGTGDARLNPSDADVPQIGDEIAVARALTDLGHRLLDVAAGDIEAVTHEHARLTT